MKSRRKLKKCQIVKEKDCEDWCFVCKDGGDLILCDFNDCLKVYHPGCVGKDDSFVKTGEHWTCDRHSCLICHKSPKFYCYCCPNAICGQCVIAAEFAPVRGKKGLCSECLELVLLVEDKEDLEIDGGKIDLGDRDTYECLFLEYWDIIKEDEGLSLDDVYTADARLKKGQHSNYSFKSKTIGKGKKDNILILSDSDLDDTQEFERTVKGKRSKALEFMGWGSKPLIEFLSSLGKDTTKELSQYDVHSIICEYIQGKRLFDPRKRKRILCDERLYSVFRRRSMNKNKLYNLLEAHFVVNLDLSDEDEKLDEAEGFSHKKTEKNLVIHKKQRTVSSNGNLQELEVDPSVRESCFASIVPDNIRLVYLRKSLVEELLKDPESFERKVVGSFVRVKNDPRDCVLRNSHQLLQVTGIKKISTTGENNGDIVLRVSNFPTDVCIYMLSDSDFCEEEIDDLKQKVEKEFLPKPTVAELEEKAKYLREDIMKDWIEKELVRLQKRIDFANEKGWRRELDEYLQQLELLKKPSEQERIIKQSPKVTAALVQRKTGSVEFVESSPEHDRSPINP
ncbi:hypothetical protein P3X46_018304 [Hevea brasiliensis]|uniref:Plus3 domain-containing protein n=1 Tax=Hevea brasiliensis TaxID=3981 RepID=A0ABQ9LQC7_HEVBR|nr:uncharacterized protein At5g08430 [Hevea brasiliensis]KAJ9170176.1 hypothetical protein P3X46_018304 [Hevea brasiliensis]